MSTGQVRKRSRAFIIMFPNSWMHFGIDFCPFVCLFLTSTKFKSYYAIVHKLLRERASCWKSLPKSFFRIPRREFLGVKESTFFKGMLLVSRNGENIFILFIVLVPGVSFLGSFSVRDVSFFSTGPIR